MLDISAHLNQAESFCLEGFEEIPVVRPGFSFYAQLLEANRPFAFVKRTHGFWDALVELSVARMRVGQDSHRLAKRILRALTRRIGVVGREGAGLDQSVRDELERKSRYKYFWGDHFVDELLDALKALPAAPNYFEAISFRGFSRPGEHERRLDSAHTKYKLRDAVLTYTPRQPRWHDAMVWKDAVTSGELRPLVRCLRGAKVIVVGPPHLSTLGNLTGIADYHHVSIHPTDAIKDRERILRRVRDVIRLSATATPTVCLFQAGSLAYWLIYRLFTRERDVFLIDIGRVLDVWYPEIVSPQPWFQDCQDRIVKNMELEDLYERHGLRQ